MNDRPHPMAPPLQVEHWFNTPEPITLVALRGKVVVLEAFQMLCPGCVSQGLPQAMRVHSTFAQDEIAVISLHTVFEHHAAMTPMALQVFLHEYRVPFPVGVDQPDPHGHIPQTMRAYAMRGTPTRVLIDRLGRLRHQHFGHVSDMALGAQIAGLLNEPAPDAPDAASISGCSNEGCAINPSTQATR